MFGAYHKERGKMLYTGVIASQLKNKDEKMQINIQGL